MNFKNIWKEIGNLISYTLFYKFTGIVHKSNKRTRTEQIFEAVTKNSSQKISLTLRCCLGLIYYAVTDKMKPIKCVGKSELLQY